MVVELVINEKQINSSLMIKRYNVGCGVETLLPSGQEERAEQFSLGD